jgi:drug/metabolite transporter (DMT)-like permease
VNHDPVQRGDRTSTAMGLAAILFWSATIAVSRSLAEQVGALTAAACMLSAGGALGCAYLAVRGRFAAMLRLPRAYLVGCGSCFVAYMACLYVAIGLATSRQQTIEVGIINYLWPGLTLVLAVPILGLKVRAGFWIGAVLAHAGVAIAPLRWGEYSPAALVEALRAAPAPYALALVAAILWALYSVLSRRLGGRGEGGAVPLFTLASGAVLAAMRLAMPEESHWTGRAVAETLFMAVFPILIAYAMWDRAMRRGRVTLVAIFSYAIPLLSTLISSVYLGVDVGWNLWLACALVAGGAALGQASVLKPHDVQA